MADVLAPPAGSPQAIRWTRDDCDKLEQAGFLTEPYELVEGSINRMGQNMPHANFVMIVLEWLFGVFGRKYVVTQASIDVRPEDNPTNAPMPDAIVLVRPSRQFAVLAQPSEIRLLVEVSNSTLDYDLTTKAGLYARANIVEYWVVSLPEQSVYVHRNPQLGHYQDVGVASISDSVAALAAPTTPLPLSQLFADEL